MTMPSKNNKKTRSKKSVLIVDEDKHLVQILAVHCRQIGLQVHVAYDAITAMAMMDEGLPNLVCLDVNMPTGNNLSICQMMMTDPEAARVPVVAITETKDAETIRRCGDMCVYYVQKSSEIWSRVEPCVYELVDIDSPAVAAEKERRGVTRNGG